MNNIQVVKQRMQTGQFSSAPDAVRLIVAKEGFRGLYAVSRGSFSRIFQKLESMLNDVFLALPLENPLFSFLSAGVWFFSTTRLTI